MHSRHPISWLELIQRADDQKKTLTAVAARAFGKSDCRCLLGIHVLEIPEELGVGGQHQGLRDVEVVCDLAQVAPLPDRLVITATRGGQLLHRVEYNLQATGALDAEQRATVPFALTEGPLDLLVQTGQGGAALVTRARQHLELGAGTNVVLADLGRGTLRLVVVPE